MYSRRHDIALACPFKNKPHILKRCHLDQAHEPNFPSFLEGANGVLHKKTPWADPVFTWDEGNSNNSGKSPSKVSPLGDIGYVLTWARHRILIWGSSCFLSGPACTPKASGPSPGE